MAKDGRDRFLATLQRKENTTEREIPERFYRISEKQFPNKTERKKKILEQLQKWQGESYISDFKHHFLNEYLALKEAFPYINFDYSGRIKSPNSIVEKVNRKIQKEKKSGNIYDIYGSKIVVHYIEEKDSQTGEIKIHRREEELQKACYEITNFLRNYNSNLLPVSRKSKDYIKEPKENGYQAIHTTRIHSSPYGYYPSEVQVRTFRMEEAQQFGTSSHGKHYKQAKNNFPRLLFISKGKKGYKVSEPPSQEVIHIIDDYHKALEER